MVTQDFMSPPHPKVHYFVKHVCACLPQNSVFMIQKGVILLIHVTDKESIRWSFHSPPGNSPHIKTKTPLFPHLHSLVTVTGLHVVSM